MVVRIAAANSKKKYFVRPKIAQIHGFRRISFTEFSDFSWFSRKKESRKMFFTPP